MISLERVIVSWLFFQNAIEVALTVQDANDPHRVPVHHIKNQKFVEFLNRPEPQPLQGGLRSSLAAPI